MTDGHIMTYSHLYTTFSASVSHFLTEKRQENSPLIRWALLLKYLKDYQPLPLYCLRIEWKERNNVFEVS